MQANSVNQNLPAKVISTLQPSRWGKLLRSVAVVTTLGMAGLTVTSPALAKPSDAEVKDLVNQANDLVKTLRVDLSSYALKVPANTLTRDYRRLSAAELPVVVWKDVMENLLSLYEQLVELHGKLGTDHNEEYYAGHVLKLRSTLLADYIKSYLPQKKKVSYLEKVQYYLRYQFADYNFPSLERLLGDEKQPGTEYTYHLPKHSLFLANTSGVRAGNYQVSSEFIQQYGKKAYAQFGSELDHWGLGYLVFANAAAEYMNLFTQRYMTEFHLENWLSDSYLKYYFENFHEKYFSAYDEFTKLNMVEFQDFVHALKDSLGTDFFSLAATTPRQPYFQKPCNYKEADEVFSSCLQKEWKELLKQAYLFGKTFEEFNLNSKLSKKLYTEVLSKDVDGVKNGSSDSYVQHRAYVLQLISQYNREVNRIRLNLLNISQ